MAAVSTKFAPPVTLHMERALLFCFVGRERVGGAGGTPPRNLGRIPPRHRANTEPRHAQTRLSELHVLRGWPGFAACGHLR